jgi:hypothetical protein
VGQGARVHLNLVAAHIQAIFRNLQPNNYAVTSPQALEYNCIAWAAGETHRRWWPSPDLVSFYWPENVTRAETIEAFIQAFRTLGYEPCDSRDFEDGYERVALYATPTGVPKHMARQKQDGIWTSKLGRLEDIDHHALEGMESVSYGQVVQILRRQIVVAA